MLGSRKATIVRDGNSQLLKRQPYFPPSFSFSSNWRFPELRQRPHECHPDCASQVCSREFFAASRTVGVPARPGNVTVTVVIYLCGNNFSHSLRQYRSRDRNPSVAVVRITFSAPSVPVLVTVTTLHSQDRADLIPAVSRRPPWVPVHSRDETANRCACIQLF